MKTALGWVELTAETEAFAPIIHDMVREAYRHHVCDVESLRFETEIHEVDGIDVTVCTLCIHLTTGFDPVYVKTVLTETVVLRQPWRQHESL